MKIWCERSKRIKNHSEVINGTKVALIKAALKKKLSVEAEGNLEYYDFIDFIDYLMLIGILSVSTKIIVKS